MKYKIFVAIIFALSLTGCDPIYKYAPGNSDLCNTKDENIIYDTDTLKLVVNSDYMQFTKEQATRLDLVVYAKSCDLHADFFKTELHPDIQVQKTFIWSIYDLDSTEAKSLVLKKWKEYHFYINFTTEYGSYLAPENRIKNININMAKVFQCNDKPVQIPEFYFASEK